MIFEQGALFKLRAALLSLVFLFLWNTMAAICNTQDLETNQVAGCDCPTSFSDANCKQCTDASCKKNVKGQLHVCNAGCVTGNLNCNACNLYFGGLCRCLKGASGCRNSGQWWLNNGHR
ncbi:hypothetical protein BDV29DRAFT_164213 [Aspergillus leporis]|jgi:hypothetical protein|uniref:Uncharacterized protein n=1 Tax=Aspergillus leporis TaxID=41062 RepID=A0A5N5XJK3_9EURO|nr:hypothetical protein BDV29DRAFT_164213 [Aspergillus leporis]